MLPPSLFLLIAAVLELADCQLGQQSGIHNNYGSDFAYLPERPDEIEEAILERILNDQNSERLSRLTNERYDSKATPEHFNNGNYNDEDDFVVDLASGPAGYGEKIASEKHDGLPATGAESDKAIINPQFGQPEEPFPPPSLPRPAAVKQSAPKRAYAVQDGDNGVSDKVFIAATTICSAAAVFGLMGAGVCWYRLHRKYKSAEGAEYSPPHYGSVKPHGTDGVCGDATLATSAQRYHYEHTKNQIVAMEQAGIESKGGQESEDSEGEAEEGDYSVYECPGLAPTDDLEVSNPLFEGNSPPSGSPPRRTTGMVALKSDIDDNKKQRSPAPASEE